MLFAVVNAIPEPDHSNQFCEVQIEEKHLPHSSLIWVVENLESACQA